MLKIAIIHTQSCTKQCESFQLKHQTLGSRLATEHRLMGGMSRITEGEMMNAKKIAIKIFEGNYLRSSIKDMQNDEVRSEANKRKMPLFVVPLFVWLFFFLFCGCYLLVLFSCVEILSFPTSPNTVHLLNLCFSFFFFLSFFQSTSSQRFFFHRAGTKRNATWTGTLLFINRENVE